MNTYAWIQAMATGLPTYMGTGDPIRKPHAIYVEDYNTVTVWCFPEGEAHGKPRTMHILYKHTGEQSHHA
jgi:hypothetical protein